MLTDLPLTVGVAIVLVPLISTLIATRWMARRAARPVEVRLTGAEVPPLPDWLPRVLDDFVSGSNGATSTFGDELDGPILLGHYARVSVPATRVEFQLRMQPHLVSEPRTRSHPVVIIIDMVEAPRRTGMSRLVFGPTPSASALHSRASLQDAVGRGARSLGLTVQAPRSNAGGAVLVAGLVLVGVAVLATFLTPLSRLTAELTAEASPTPWYPASATACPGPAKSPAKPPTSTAVAKGTSCAFAETVRAAYARAKLNGKTVRLGKLRYDRKTTVPVTCAVGHPVIVCSGSKKIVYLR